jgi:hypothetical protein
MVPGAGSLKRVRRLFHRAIQSHKASCHQIVLVFVVVLVIEKWLWPSADTDENWIVVAPAVPKIRIGDEYKDEKPRAKGLRVSRYPLVIGYRARQD